MINPHIKTKCALLKRTIPILGLFEWILVLLGTYFLGEKEVAQALWLYLAYALVYIANYELSFMLQHIIIRLELEKQEAKNACAQS